MPITVDRPETKQDPGQTKLEKIPRYAVILHNDDDHGMQEVVLILIEIFRFTLEKATRLMLEAHFNGQSTVMVTHFERAELYRDKLRSKTLIASIERLD